MRGKKDLSRDNLFIRISEIIDSARGSIARAVNFEMVKAYWLIGQEIVNEEQKGSTRAEYGEKIIEKLSQALTKKYGTGWSASHLWHVRQFYTFYRDRTLENLHTTRADSNHAILHTLRAELSWSHYRILMRVEGTVISKFLAAEIKQPTAAESCESFPKLSTLLTELS